MVWSKLKKHIENNFADSLKNRVKLYITTYGSDYDVQDLYNRAWITIDGIEIVNFSTPQAFFMHRKDLNDSTPTRYTANTKRKSYAIRTDGQLTEKGEFSKFDLTFCCTAFLEMAISDSLIHESPVIRMLAVLDKRVGKRRLSNIDAMEEHPLVRYFLNVRMTAEGIKSKESIS